MYCNESIHLYLHEDGYIDCPFCYEIMQNPNPQTYKCCDDTDITNYDLCLICKNCASVHGYQLSKEYIDFYEKRYRIKRKSVYNRKYHLQNKIINICILNNTHISYINKQKILDIFKKIDQILPIVNNKTRKRMIKIDFILNKLFHLLNMNIKISQKESKKAFLYNEKYWNQINSLIGKEIQSILVR